VRPVTLALVIVLLPSAGSAQRADGTYPLRLACDAGGGSGIVRATGTATIGGGQASYEIRIGSGRETGAGVLASGKISLTGKGPGYEARYGGDVSGRGGFLSGYQTGKGFRRVCQLVLGEG
jgi:hypothetical protein